MAAVIFGPLGGHPRSLLFDVDE